MLPTLGIGGYEQPARPLNLNLLLCRCAIFLWYLSPLLPSSFDWRKSTNPNMCLFSKPGVGVNCGDMQLFTALLLAFTGIFPKWRRSRRSDIPADALNIVTPFCPGRLGFSFSHCWRVETHNDVSFHGAPVSSAFCGGVVPVPCGDHGVNRRRGGNSCQTFNPAADKRLVFNTVQYC